MHESTAADFTPLSYGPGLAIGLMMILGLPATSAAASASSRRRSSPAIAGERSDATAAPVSARRSHDG